MERNAGLFVDISVEDEPRVASLRYFWHHVFDECCTANVDELMVEATERGLFYFLHLACDWDFIWEEFAFDVESWRKTASVKPFRTCHLWNGFGVGLGGETLSAIGHDVHRQIQVHMLHPFPTIIVRQMQEENLRLPFMLVNVQHLEVAVAVRNV